MFQLATNENHFIRLQPICKRMQLTENGVAAHVESFLSFDFQIKRKYFIVGQDSSERTSEVIVVQKIKVL
jgi:hypothetical protein